MQISELGTDVLIGLYIDDNLPRLIGKSANFSLWCYMRGIDEEVGHVAWARAFCSTVDDIERRTMACLKQTSDKPQVDLLQLFLEVILMIALKEANGLITLTKEQDAKQHARLYDARLRMQAFARAFSKALDDSDPLLLDALKFLQEWHAGLNEQYAGGLRSRLLDLLKSWSVSTNSPLVFEDLHGISYDKARGAWDVRTAVSGERRRLGRYTTRAEACLALLKHEQEHPETERKGRKLRNDTKYVGVEKHPILVGKWLVVPPREAAYKIDEYADELGVFTEDADEGRLGFGEYHSRQRAAEAYDLFVRQQELDAPLNFPLRGERNAQGQIYSPEGQQEHDTQVLELLKPSMKRAYEPIGRSERWNRQEFELRGELLATKAKSVYVGEGVAWALAFFSWHVVDLSENRGLWENLKSDFRYAAAWAGGSSFGAEDEARVILDELERGGGTAIYAHLDREIGVHLALQDAVFAATFGYLPAPGSVRHSASADRYDYSIDALEWD